MTSELLYLLNLLYNMPSECCDEYNLYNLNQKSSVWCFASSHTSTFELIPAVIETAQTEASVTQGTFAHTPSEDLDVSNLHSRSIFFYFDINLRELYCRRQSIKNDDNMRYLCCMFRKLRMFNWFRQMPRLCTMRRGRLHL